jgi:hypothetical protein
MEDTVSIRENEVKDLSKKLDDLEKIYQEKEIYIKDLSKEVKDLDKS